MKLASFDDHRIGVVLDNRIHDVTACVPAALDVLPDQRMRWLVAHWDEARGPVERVSASAQGVALDAVRLLAPVPAPGHVFAAPVNYRKHIGELGDRAVSKKGRSAREQGFFLKAPASVVGPSEGITLPRGSQRRFDHESELAVVIGHGGRDIPRARAMEHVFGYTCLMDLTMRIEDWFSYYLKNENPAEWLVKEISGNN